jgi:hypothetical protein
MHTDLGDGHVLIDGEFVSAKVEQVVLAIKEYEPELEVKWLPERARFDENGDPLPAFQIWHNEPGKRPLLLFNVMDEKDFDLRVLQRIIVNDQRNGKQQFSELVAFEEAAKLVAKQEYLDRMEEAEDMAKHILGSRLHSYRVNKDLIVKDGIPFNAARLKKD